MIVNNKNNPTALKKHKEISYQLFGVTTKFEDVGMPKGTECIDRKLIENG